MSLQQLENERSELIMRISSLKEDIRSLEDQVKDMATRLTETQDDATQNRSNANQMKWVMILFFSLFGFYSP